ncbi:hypothetical protein [Streptomyces sp. NPDC047097]|uniref:hypothetical protein n=1 Tax=Streptomyces sp. NPDC047097 TaxID=3155260 RepID=UPI0033C358A3
MHNTKPGEGKQARILAAALRTWATTTHDNTPTAVRIDIRQPPAWRHVATNNLTQHQQARLLAFLHDDLANYRPGQRTPEHAATVIRGLLAELTAAGHTHLTTADLTTASPRIGRSRAWIAAHIADLIDTGRLVETRRPGIFRIP